MLNRIFLHFMFICAALPAIADEVTFLNAGDTLSAELPFSEAVQVGNMVFLSGQIGVKPGTLTLVDGGIREETRQVMDNIEAVLIKNGLSLRDVVKCTVMLADMDDWPTFNKVYRSYFQPPYPARSAFGANGLGLGARTEVECWAVKP